jgi:hypothetical protein
MRFRSALPPNSPVSVTRSRRILVASFQLALAVAATVVTGGCDGQGEGQLCNPKAGNGGNNDCQSGLTCQSRPAIVMAPYGLCCEPNGQSTTSACSQNGLSGNANPAPPDGSSPADAPFEGAAADVVDGSDAPSSSADAPPSTPDSAGDDGPDATLDAGGSDATTE